MNRLKSNSGWWKKDGQVLYIYLNGSENYSDWVRNFMVGRVNTKHGWTNRVDRKEAISTHRELRKEIRDCKEVKLAGHSRGASEAYNLAVLLFEKVKVSVYLFAPKATGCREFTSTVNYLSYRHRGDWVPFLIFWYARFKNITFGKFKPIWIAHEPREYYEKMRLYGF